MALSGSTDFSLNRDEIIKGALRVLGKRNLTGAGGKKYLTQGSEALNMLLKAWQADGIGLWKKSECTLYQTAGTEYYSLGSSGDHCAIEPIETEVATAASSGASELVVDSITGMSDADAIGIELDDGTLQWTTINGAPASSTITLTASLTDDVAVDRKVYTYTSKIPRPLAIENPRRRDKDDNDMPLGVCSRSDYMNLPDKDEDGDCSMVYFDPQRTSARLYTWPTCDDVTDRIVFTGILPVEDFDASTDDADIPQEWFRALKYNLAVDLAPEVEVEASADVLRLARTSKAVLEGFDRENSSIIFEVGE